MKSFFRCNVSVVFKLDVAACLLAVAAIIKALT